jgi:hypothetical protein
VCAVWDEVQKTSRPPEDGETLPMDSIDYMTLQEAEHEAPFPPTQHEWDQRKHIRKLRVFEARAAIAGGHDLTPTQLVDEVSKPMHFRKAQCFPTKRRPAQRQMSEESDSTVEAWFQHCGVRIFDGLSPCEAKRARRLLYT